MKLNKNKNEKGYYDNSGCGLALSIVAILAIILSPFIINSAMGFFPFGPYNSIEAKVERLYVDNNSEASYYMVGTDKGVFEVSNSFWIGIYNADEIYSDLEQGKTYKLATKGNKVTNFFFQEYPRIISTKEVK